jgi:hypothetical protein
MPGGAQADRNKHVIIVPVRWPPSKDNVVPVDMDAVVKVARWHAGYIPQV